ncbi:flagellar export chaperone FlgN [Phaeobacter porticola]|uniref:FlgN-like protein n=1 Tax=Phaeobacter porticola TaxID=1844006 RepID=A0A1L3I9P4_9RHOB|nr:flagellar export chaperone FlgN [Phaeobacter porticola]APG48711.1 FlgN-like protein [Phaeobacter porticola]
MTDQTPQQLIEELDTLLDAERAALVKGNLQELEPLLAKKEEIITTLNMTSDLEREALEHVQGKVSRNQVLLDSAMEGIRAVAARMAELRQVRKGLDVYDQSGRKTRFTTRNTPSLEKRA